MSIHYNGRKSSKELNRAGRSKYELKNINPTIRR